MKKNKLLKQRIVSLEVSAQFEHFLRGLGAVGDPKSSAAQDIRRLLQSGVVHGGLPCLEVASPYGCLERLTPTSYMFAEMVPRVGGVMVAAVEDLAGYVVLHSCSRCGARAERRLISDMPIDDVLVKRHGWVAEHSTCPFASAAPGKEASALASVLFRAAGR